MWWEHPWWFGLLLRTTLRDEPVSGDRDEKYRAAPQILEIDPVRFDFAATLLEIVTIAEEFET